MKPSDAQDKALDLALRFLSYRSRSEAEVERHLLRSGYSSAIIGKTLERLRALHYVDDEAFARNWALARTQKRGDGPKKIELELRAKGIDQGVAREVTRETFSQLDEAETARKLLQKKYHVAKFSNPKAIQRAAAFLQNRGYSDKTISDVLHCPIEDY
ncbi:MAG TPA: regulatory protein RecX [Candidatus Acidoferrales bacterium]|nr:regulatory protein RecX [Candidatus Acidoferrales bacterium]